MQISYTKSAQHALKYAARAAREMKHPYIGTEHLLLGIERRIYRSGRTGTCEQWSRVGEDPEVDG